ncbi:MAG: hypothetical protein CMJ83_01320 [Planctomycetes bacterium]|nr:hypothetical protein [Planctomycetota bacterium]
MRCIAVLAVLAVVVPAQPDLRTHYDVLTYRLDLEVKPKVQTLDGWSAIEAKVVAEGLDTLHLDASPNLEVDRVIHLDGALDGTCALKGRKLKFTRDGDALLVTLGKRVPKGGLVRVAVRYRSKPVAGTGRRRRGPRTVGVRWSQSADGSPWVGTSCQGPGAHSWWPCKSNWYHPDDKFATLYVNATVPKGLYAVSNGVLVSRKKKRGKSIFSWRHPYPCETYCVTLNVGPYVVVEQKLALPGLEKKVPFIYYVLPENAKKAALQFKQVPELLKIYSERFGPWPFPDAKFALVETSFWGMEHSTAVAYGSSYPAWCKKTNTRDRYAARNRHFDYILVHEVAHEWWGNAVSAEHWGHFWIHEGFGTYAEGVYVEFTQGREAADQYFGSNRGGRGSLYRGDHPNSRLAYSGLIYSKGSRVLHTLRHYVDDDDAWWKSLRDFNQKHRYGNATTEDFQSVLEANTQKKWGRFFKEWFYGSGTPQVLGVVRARNKGVELAIEIKGDFHVPLDLTWTENGKSKTARRWLEPGQNDLTIACQGRPKGLAIPHLGRVLGRHSVSVE